MLKPIVEKGQGWSAPAPSINALSLSEAPQDEIEQAYIQPKAKPSGKFGNQSTGNSMPRDLKFISDLFCLDR